MKAALDQGEIPKKIRDIPNNKLIMELNSPLVLLIPTENMITGILNKITIMLPIEKLVLFNKFIDAEIEPKHEKINEPIKKVNSKLYNSIGGRLKNILAIGIENKKGICMNIKCEIIFNKTNNS